MGPWLSRSLLLTAIFSASWGAAIWYWRSTNRMPTSTDLALLLLALPTAILSAIWLGKKLFLLVTSAPAGAALQPGAGAAPAVPPAQRAGVLDLVAGAIRVPHGQSCEQLRGAIEAKTAKVALDPELTDDDGYPVLSARMDDVDELAQQEAMAPWLNQNGLAQLHFSGEQWRALALGSEVVTELAQTAVMHKLLPDYQSATPAARAALALPVLLLAPLLSAQWDGAQRSAAGQWFLHLIAQQGWPAERLALSGASERTGATPFALIDHLSLQSERDALPCLAIVFACESRIGEDSVRDWAAQGTLFTSANQRGQIPGEGAAGLLLADAQQAALIDDASSVQLHGACEGARESSSDGNGRVSAELLTSLSQQALRAGATEPAAVSLITADTDQRASRMAELMAMANATFPQLDLATEVIGVAASCGSAGAVPSITALALAGHEVATNAGHVLCLSNQDPFQRCAVSVRPKAAPQASMPQV